MGLRGNTFAGGRRAIRQRPWRAVPTLRGGLTWFSESTLGVNATFQGAPASAGTFASVSDLDQTVANVSAGLDILDPNDGFDLRFSYDGRFGEENVEIHSGSARFIVNY